MRERERVTRVDAPPDNAPRRRLSPVEWDSLLWSGTPSWYCGSHGWRVRGGGEGEEGEVEREEKYLGAGASEDAESDRQKEKKNAAKMVVRCGPPPLGKRR